jgi:transposase-like protein
MDSQIIVVRKEGKRRMVKRFVLDEFKCKYCGGANLVLYGKQKNQQQWWCKDCQRKFSGTLSLPKMRSPVAHVGSAVQQYFDGQSLNEICRNIEQQYGYKPNNSTIYRWVEEFTDRAIKETKDIHPKVGDVWIADETVIKVGGVNYWFWDCIDADTRFLLASRMVTTRGTRDARALMELAEERAGKTPKVVVTDKLNSYLDGIELAFGSDTLHKQGSPFNLENNTNLIERFQGSLKDRTKILRGLKKPETARRFLEGWLIHYNFFRPHEGIEGKTPADKAGVKFEHKDWLDLIRSPKDTAKITVSTEPKPILRLHHPPMPRMTQTRFTPRIPKHKAGRGYILHADGRRERQRRGTVI